MASGPCSPCPFSEVWPSTQLNTSPVHALFVLHSVCLLVAFAFTVGVMLYSTHRSLKFQPDWHTWCGRSLNSICPGPWGMMRHLCASAYACFTSSLHARHKSMCIRWTARDCRVVHTVCSMKHIARLNMSDQTNLLGEQCATQSPITNITDGSSKDGHFRSRPSYSLPRHTLKCQGKNRTTTTATTALPALPEQQVASCLPLEHVTQLLVVLEDRLRVPACGQ